MKIDDSELLRLKAEGKSVKELASHFGVSRVAIWKKLKRLTAMPVSFRKLTDRQKKFVLSKVEGKTNTQSAMEAFEVTSRDSAKALGYKLMKDPDINKAISDLMAEEGLTRRYVVQRLRKLIDHPDGHIAIKTIDITNKMRGEYPRPEIHFEQNIITPELKAKIHHATSGMIEVFLVSPYKEGKPLDEEMMEFFDTCPQEIEELIGAEDYLGELEALHQRRAEKIAQELGISFDEALAVLKERNRKARLQIQNQIGHES